MNVTLANALGKHSKISVGNGVQTSDDVKLPLKSDFLDTFSPKLNSKESLLQNCKAELDQLNDYHNTIHQKLNHLQQEEIMLKNELGRLHSLIIARKRALHQLPSSQIPTITSVNSNNVFGNFREYEDNNNQDDDNINVEEDNNYGDDMNEQRQNIWNSVNNQDDNLNGNIISPKRRTLEDDDGGWI